MSKDKIKFIVIHCSDSNWGSANEIDHWHKARGWKGIGYSYVISNCYPTYHNYINGIPHIKSDGKVVAGREEGAELAHAKGFNFNSIAICLIGRKVFSTAQLRSLKIKVKKLQYDYGYKLKVIGHNETDSGIAQGKTCPNLNMVYLRQYLEEE